MKLHKMVAIGLAMLLPACVLPTTEPDEPGVADVAAALEYEGEDQVAQRPHEPPAEGTCGYVNMEDVFGEPVWIPLECPAQPYTYMGDPWVAEPMPEVDTLPTPME